MSNFNDVRDAIEQGATKDDIERAIKHAEPFEVGNARRPGGGTYGRSGNGKITHEWPEPVPLTPDHGPEIDLNVLPDCLRQAVETVAESVQVKPDAPAAIALAAFSAAASKLVVVKPCAGYCEPVNIYTALVLPSGARKSAVFQRMIAPVLEWEGWELEQGRGALSRDRERFKLAKTRLEHLNREVARAKDKDRARLEGELDRQAEAVGRMREPQPPRLVTDDVTPEKVACLLRDHGGRIFVAAPECDVLDVMGGRYSKDGRSNIGVFQRGHTGEPLRVDRMGRESIHVPSPAITIALACQPSVLREIAAKPELRGRGLLARFVFVLPESTVGYRAVDPRAMDEAVLRDYADHLKAVLNLPRTCDEWGYIKAATLSLAPEALDEYNTFRAVVEPDLRRLERLGAICDWASKSTGLALRIAGVLHLAEARLEDPRDRPISGETMAQAVKLTQHYTEHALAAFGAMRATAVTRDAGHLLDWISNMKPKRFTKRDAHRASQRHFEQASDLDAPLSVLVEHGYLRRAATPEAGNTKGGQPPSPIFKVNPAAYLGPG